MKLPGDYTALERIGTPGNPWVTGYQPGDDVPAGAVENWALEVGKQVALNETYQPPRPAEDSDNRATWEAYVIGQGTDLDAARAASLDDLRGLYEAPAEPAPQPVIVPDDVQPAGTERPADGALKAAWVEYVVTAGADEQWANDPATTKADLVAWSPSGNA